MSRTTACRLIALCLVFLSFGTMSLRRWCLGPQALLASGSAAWKLTWEIEARSLGPGTLTVQLPSEIVGQSILAERLRTEECGADLHADEFGRRAVLVPPPRIDTPFRVRYEAVVSLEGRPGLAIDPPEPGRWTRGEPGIDSDHPAIARAARTITEGRTAAIDQATRLHEAVAEMAPATSDDGNLSLDEVLARRQATAEQKARLLTALLRNRGIAARMVIGILPDPTSGGREAFWVEARLRDCWLPIDPLGKQIGTVPTGVICLGRASRGWIMPRNVRILSTERSFRTVPTLTPENATTIQRIFLACSLTRLPTAERRLVEFLLLLPIGAVIVCACRTIIGLTTFGTFAPALLGLAFRETIGLFGVAVFMGVLFVGWSSRRTIERLHLLQVPRTGLMLTLIVAVLIAFVFISVHLGISAARGIGLFPLVILTGIVEQFWLRDEEDGAGASLNVLMTTLLVAGLIALVTSWSLLTGFLTRYPEALGLIAAAMILIGRYSGYRITELYRFRDLADDDGPASRVVAVRMVVPRLSRAAPHFQSS